MTLTAARLPSSSLSEPIDPLRTITATVVSGGASRTTAPGASTTASSPCSMAWNVATVLLSTISSRPDCSTGTATAPLSNFEISTSMPSSLKKPCLSAMTAASDSENGNRPSLIFSWALAGNGDSSTLATKEMAQDHRRT
jgi:hypothetical protein